jgi:hypothetical protein
LSVYFSYLADELADIGEQLADPALAPYAGALRGAVGRALVLACEAGRAAAAHQAGPPPATDPARQARANPA